LRIDVLTIFPGLFGPFLEESILGAALRRGLLAVAVHDLRDWARDRHRTVDDAPYGGGPGMVMKPEPLVAALEALAGAKGPGRKARVALLSPQGDPLDQARLAQLATLPHLVLVCGRYEGVDQRAIDLAIDEELSIGDYVLSGGELPALVVIEGISRLLPGVVGNPESVVSESFQAGLLEGPHYTRRFCANQPSRRARPSEPMKDTSQSQPKVEASRMVSSSRKRPGTMAPCWWKRVSFMLKKGASGGA
jgi:tRNA (guanine37-N1)-methyltransferase